MDKKAKSTVTVFYKIDNSELISSLWGIYQQAFAGQEVRNPQNQCFWHDLQSFQIAMGDEDWQKHVAFDDQKPTGLVIITKNLEKARIGYINPECFEAAAPQHIGEIYYVGVMFILKEYQNTPCFWDIFSSVFEHTVSKGGVIAFDVNGTLMPDFQKAPLALLKSKGIPASAECLGRQEYWMIFPKKQ